MSSQWDGQGLLQPIAADQPCGENLEDTPLLASFDSFRVFGSQTSRDIAPPAEPGVHPEKLPDWNEVKTHALDTLGRSKDLRVLAYLGAALLRTDGVQAFCQTIQVASQWLETNWAATYPLVDEAPTGRQSALNCFSDRMAVIDGLRRAPLVSNRLGRVSLRDADAAGPVSPDKEPSPEQKHVDALFLAAPLEELKALRQSVIGAIAALRRIEAQMREAGPDAAPTFEPLLVQLTNGNKLFERQLAKRPDAEPDVAVSAESVGAGGAPTAGVNVKGIASREDAIRALDAVADFFRRAEPSSPVPLLVDRAKRLVSKNFLEVLEEIAPGGLDQARSAGGVREGE
jgi:type VI secretion system protein ImpA